MPSLQCTIIGLLWPLWTVTFVLSNSHRVGYAHALANIDEHSPSTKESLLVGLVSDVHLRFPAGRKAACSCYSPQSKDSDSIMEPNTNDCDKKSGKDTTDDVLLSLLAHYKLLAPFPDILVIGGDNVQHNLQGILCCHGKANSPGTCPSHMAMTHLSLFVQAYFTHLVCKSLASRQQHVFPVAGNNDLPTDWALPHAGSSFWFRALFRIWWKLISACGTGKAPSSSGFVMLQKHEIQQAFQTGGFYRVHLQAGVDVLALNTVLWSVKARHRRTAHSRLIAELQLLWFTRCLEECANNKRKVIIVGHVPPGIDAFYGKPTWLNHFRIPYLEILDEYSDIIIGQFFSHFHRDSFRVLGHNQHRCRSGRCLLSSVLEGHQRSLPTLLFVSPAVSPAYGNLPAYRVYNVTFQQPGLDFDQYYYYQGVGTGISRWQKDYRLSSWLHTLQLNHQSSLVQQFQELSKKVQNSQEEELWQQFCCKYFVHREDAESMCRTNPTIYDRISCALDAESGVDYENCLLLHLIRDSKK